MQVSYLPATDTYSPATTEEMKVMFKKAKKRSGENVAHLESLIPVSVAYCGLIPWISEGFY